MNKRQSTTAAIAVAASLTLTLTACGSGSSSNKGGEKVKLGVALSSLNNPFFVQVKKGAEAEAKGENAELSVQDAQDDASQQANQIQNFASQNMKGIIVNPVDSDAAGASVKAANNADIPVLAVDREVNKAETEATVTSDNVDGGRQAAQQLGKMLGGQGEILMLRGQAGTSASRERGKGFTEGMKKFPGIKIVAKQTADFDRAKGLDVTTNMLQANPNVDAVFSENDEMALGAIKALGDKAGDDVKVIGFDGTAEGFKAVKQGTMTLTIAQQPEELGRMAVRNALRAVDGSQVDKQIKVPVKAVNAKNVDQYN